MVNITIDNQKISVSEDMTIKEAAKELQIIIPSLCYLKNLNEIAACKVCVVELEGIEKLVTSCNNLVKEGMVIKTNSPKVLAHRRKNVQLLLSQHDGRCSLCTRSSNCNLQKIANDLNIIDLPFAQNPEPFRWNKDFPLIKDASKCIKCMRCIQICEKVQALSIWDVEGTGARTTVNVSQGRQIENSNCSLCGQCITHCPVGALRERDDTDKIWDAIANEKTVTVVQIAPAVRAAWGEAFGLSQEEATFGKIVDALRKIGVDYVFDTTFTADLTIMEEGSEFLHKFATGQLENHPMFTSCCPGWVRYIKANYPHMAKYLSSAKSPQQMFGAVMKTYFANSIGVKPENITTISIMPCLAKKDECTMELYYEEFAGNEVDIAITTRELTRMLRSAHINPKALKDVDCDHLMQEASGAGVIFGATGGVMEAALRSAYALALGTNPEPDAFKIVRSEVLNPGIVSAEINIGEHTIKAAVVSSLGNAKLLLDKIQSGQAQYHFVEVMACPGGCVGGGGQPIHDGEEFAINRGKNLYFLDKNAKIRFSHENQDVQKLYKDFLGEPLSFKSHQLLHTH